MIELAFAPNSAGKLRGSLSIYASARNSPRAILLAGKGIP
jgi:hypothetical protein